MRLLYLENHALFAAAVTQQFLKQHQVTLVPSVTLARRLFDESEFDLIIVDYDLDDGKGTEFVEYCCVVAPNLPIIAASAHEKGNRLLLEAGAWQSCSKLEFASVQLVINACIGRSKIEST